MKNYRIYCLFEDGNSGILNLNTYIQKGGIFSYLNDEGNVKNFLVKDGVLTWNSEQIDIAPESVYHSVTGKPLPKWTNQAYF